MSSTEINNLFNVTDIWDIATSTANATQQPGSGHELPYSVAVTAVLATLAALTSLCTVVGNTMVVLSFALEKSIRQPSNYLIASLAVTDILIGLFSMPLYTLYLLHGVWPLGQVICDLWLSLDYTVCLVSQYTVFLITLDRFCSVKVPTKYRNWRTPNKMKIMIAVTWLVPALIFFTSIMGWHHFVGGAPVDDRYCEAQFQKDKTFTAILVISYYWVTLVIMIGLYAGIYKVALTLHSKANAKRNRIKQMHSLKAAEATDNNGNNAETEPLHSKLQGSNGNCDSLTTTSSSACEKKANGRANLQLSGIKDVKSSKDIKRNKQQETKEESDYSDHSSDSKPIDSTQQITQQTSVAPAEQQQQQGEQLESPLWKPRTSLPNASINWNAFTETAYSTLERKVVSNGGQNFTETVELEEQADSVSSSSQPSADRPKVLLHLTRVISSVAQMKPKNFLGRKESGSKKHKSKSENRARKALRTITFILGAFVICWTPYHVAVLIFAFCKKVAPDTCLNVTFYSFTYWLCYGNSPLNPFAYALANQQFKKAFLKILKGEYIRMWLNRR